MICLHSVSRSRRSRRFRFARPARLDTPHRRLGALYVAEGSTLGGRELSKRLDHLFGHDGAPAAASSAAAKRIPERPGAPSPIHWTPAGEDPAARSEMIAAAIETFAAFETWMDWKAGTDAGP